MKHLLITGAAGAIGSALADAFGARFPRASLALVDRDGEALARVAARFGPRAAPLVWDLAAVATLDARFAEATREAPVDGLINCAGFMEMRSFAATPWALGERLLAVDLIAPLRLMSLAVPAMPRGGFVVNVSSMAGLVPLRGASFYGAAKAGLGLASEIAHLELRERGVRVVTVYPGPVRSALERGARAQMPRTLLARAIPTGEPDALAARVVAAVEKHHPRVVYPDAYNVAEQFLGVARRLTARVSPRPLT